MLFTGFSLARISRAIAQEFRARHSVRTLESMDDRMLADMGITRGDIDDAVRGPARRRR